MANTFRALRIASSITGKELGTGTGSQIQANSINFSEISDTLNLDANLNILGNFNFSINNSNFFVNPTNGRVGMGTAGPGRKLEVFDSSNAYNGVNVRNLDAGGSARAAVVMDNGASFTAIGHMGTGAGGFGFIDTQIMYFNGKVGIGTASPVDKLQIEDGSNNIILIVPLNSSFIGTLGANVRAGGLRLEGVPGQILNLDAAHDMQINYNTRSIASGSTDLLFTANAGSVDVLFL